MEKIHNLNFVKQSDGTFKVSQPLAFVTQTELDALYEEIKELNKKNRILNDEANKLRACLKSITKLGMDTIVK